jgi:hypothetical protein
MKKTIITTALSVAMVCSVAGVAFASVNPSGTGQPNASCGSENATQMPNGFTTNGFSHAEAVYAGSDGTPSQANGQSSHAVSQYDVACYQLTQNQ